MLSNGFLTAFGIVDIDFGWIWKGPKLADFEQKPLNLSDLGMCWESLQTPWNASYILENTFLTAFGIIAMDFGWIRKGPKVADFELKPWAIAHGFEQTGFG